MTTLIYEDLLGEIGDQLPDNGLGEITAARLRALLTDLVDSGRHFTAGTEPASAVEGSFWFDGSVLRVFRSGGWVALAHYTKAEMDALLAEQDASIQSIDDVLQEWAAGGLVGGVLRPEQFGAVGDGATDDTAAFDLMFAAAEAALQRTYVSATQRNILGVSGAPVIQLTSDKHYRYGGAGWRPAASTGARSIIMDGGGRNGAQVTITSDAYLIDVQVGGIELNAIHATGITISGGKGFYCNRVPTAVGQGGRYFHNLQIIDFSECAIAEHRGDCPRFVVTDCTIESSRPGTVGIFLPLVVAGPNLTGTSVIGCRYGVVLYGKPGTSSVGQADTFISGLRCFNIPAQTDHVANLWLQTHDPSTSFQNSGQHVIVKGNSFTNENRNGDPVILIAARDDSNGSVALHMRPHVASATTQIFRDLVIEGNTFSGSGSPDEPDPAVTGPAIRSYAQDLGALRIAENYFSTAFTYIFDLVPEPGDGYVANMVIGPNHFSGIGEPPIRCSRPVGVWLGDAGEVVPSFGTPSTAAGMDDRFALLSRVGSAPVLMDDVTLTGSASSIVAPDGDVMGGANGLQITFTASDEYVNIPITGVDGLAAGQLIYVELDLKQANATSLGEVDVLVTLTGPDGASPVRRAYNAPSAWQTLRLPVRANGALTSATVRVYPSADSFSVGVRDSVRIGRPRVYAANVPTNFGHFGTVNAAWDAGHLVMRGEGGQEFHIWPDFTASRLRWSAARPTSETDGTLI